MNIVHAIVAVAGLSIVTALTACRDRRPSQTFSQPPAAIVESFQHFADSVAPQLYKVLDSARIHSGWSDTSSDGKRRDTHVSQLTPAEARAQIYEADLTLTLHEHLGTESDFPLPKNLFLQFATVGAGERWALLTSRGYAFTLVTESHRNDLPLDLELGVRNVFGTRMEFADWMAFRRAKLGKTESVAPTR